MKKFDFLLLILLLSSYSCFAQKAEILKILAKHEINANVLDNNAKENAKNMRFSVKQTTESSNSYKVELAKYDGKKTAGQRWALQSVDGKMPGAGQVKAFLKAHPENIPIAPVDEESYRIIEDNEDGIIIRFGYLRDSLNKENSFLKDCTSKLFINRKTKLLEKQETQNNVPLKIKGIKVPKLLTIINFNYDKDTKKYLVLREQTNLVIQLLVITADNVVTSEYSNYEDQ